MNTDMTTFALVKVDDLVIRSLKVRWYGIQLESDTAEAFLTLEQALTLAAVIRSGTSGEVEYEEGTVAVAMSETSSATWLEDDKEPDSKLLLTVSRNVGEIIFGMAEARLRVTEAFREPLA